VGATGSASGSIRKTGQGGSEHLASTWLWRHILRITTSSRMVLVRLREPHGVKDSTSSRHSEADRSNSNPRALSGSKAALLPDLSASTQEILARVQAESATGTSNKTSLLTNDFDASAMSANVESLLSPDSVSSTTTQFQRPRMGSGMFDKSKLKSAFASALIPRSKTLPSQPLKDSTIQTSVHAGSSAKAAAQSEKAQQFVTGQSNAASSSMKSDESTIVVMSSPDKSASVGGLSAVVGQGAIPSADKTETPKSKIQISHTYVLPSGEVVNSGKGLGRGRPGIKRGPRKPKSDSTSTPSGLKSTSRKRKRSADSDVEDGQKSRSPSKSPSDSGDEYEPQATQTRSGRHTQRPTTFVPPASPSHKKPRLSSSAPTSNGKLTIKRKVYKGKEQSALCEHCLRGYGPLKNAIVFCDGCNRCWHQRCHGPMIPRKLVLDPSSEWFCNECTAIKERSKKKAPTQKAGNASAKAEITVTAPAPATEAARKAYLSSLPKDRLIDLLMQASTLTPSLPIWQPQQPAPTQPPPMTTTPASSSTTKAEAQAYPTPKHDLTDPEEPNDYDEYSDLEDEHAKLYPRPGNGVQLPPESEDLDMLLEGRESRTFSHSLREGIVGVVEAGVGVEGVRKG
jgi:PHD-finger